MCNEVDDAKDGGNILRREKSCHRNIADVEAHGSAHSADADDQWYCPCGSWLIKEYIWIHKISNSTHQTDAVGDDDTLGYADPLQEDTTGGKSYHVSEGEANGIDENTTREVL